MQVLLFSATFSDQIKNFTMQISPSANHMFVAKEKLSLDVIAQYIVRCAPRDLTAPFPPLRAARFARARVCRASPGGAP